MKKDSLVPKTKMDAQPDTDQLLLAYLHGVGDVAVSEESRLERSDSALSLASTIAFDAAPAAPTAPRVIKAFCPFNQLFVTIPFPNEDDGWIYRYDIGGYLGCTFCSQHSGSRTP